MVLKKQGIVAAIWVLICVGWICPSDTMAANAQYRFKLASLAPGKVGKKYVGWSKYIKEIIEPAVKKASDGNIALKWYWGGVQGNDRDYIKKMKIGQLDGAAFTGQGVALACPEMVVLELPFMFNSYHEVDYIRKKMYPTFDTYAQNRGYRLIVWGDQDFDQIYSTKKRLDSVDSFKGEKFVTWYGAPEEKLLKALGANPTPINVTEIAASVRQGVANDLIAPAVWVLGTQLYTKFKHVNPVKIRYSPAAVFVTQKAFDRVPEKYRKGILAMRDNEAVTFYRKTRQYTQRVYQAMVPKYLKPTEMNAKELEKLQQRTRSIWNEMAGAYFPEALLAELLAHLAAFRSQTK